MGGRDGNHRRGFAKVPHAILEELWCGDTRRSENAMIDLYILNHTSWGPFNWFYWDRFGNRREVRPERGQAPLCEREMVRELRLGHKKVRVRIATLVGEGILKSMGRVGKTYGTIYQVEIERFSEFVARGQSRVSKRAQQRQTRIR